MDTVHGEVDVNLAAADVPAAAAALAADATCDHAVDSCSDGKGAPAPAAGVTADIAAATAETTSTAPLTTPITTAVSPSSAVAVAVAVDDSAAPKSKLTRASLTIHEKTIVKSFCEQRVEESKARGEVVPSQELLRRDVLHKFGWEMGRSTLSKVLLMDWKDLGAGTHRNPSMKRKRKPLFPAFEADLVKYIGAHVAQHEATLAASQSLEIAALGVPGGTKLAGGGTTNNSKSGHALTEAVILEEAQRLKLVHGIRDEELVLSVGWLARFKHRNGIRLRKGSSTHKQLHTTFIATAAAALSAPHELLFDDTPSSHSSSTSNGGHKAVVLGGVVGSSDAPATSFQTPSPCLEVAPLVPPQPLALEPSSPSPKRIALTLPPTIPTTTTTTSSAVEPHQPQLHQLSLASSLQRSPLCAFLMRDAVRSAALERAVATVPSAIRAFACKCEAALPTVAVRGLRVAVLGHQSAAEAFVLAALVGPNGAVTCVDSDAASVRLAVSLIDDHAAALGYAAPNVRVLHGLRSGSSTTATAGSAATVETTDDDFGATAFDLVVLNCSLRALAPSDATMAHVLAAAHRALRDGGEVQLSTCCSSRRLSPAFCRAYSAKLQAPDVQSDSHMSDGHFNLAIASAVQPLPPHSRKHVAVIECAVVVDELLHAVYAADFRRIACCAGFAELRRLPEHALVLVSDSGATSAFSTASSARFAVAVWRLFKTAPRIEDSAEDYGQYAVYTGGSTDSSSSSSDNTVAEADVDDDVYELDQHFCFARGAHVRVDGNTALLLQHSWLQRAFTVVGDQSSHLGAFVSSCSNSSSNSNGLSFV